MLWRFAARQTQLRFWLALAGALFLAGLVVYKYPVALERLKLDSAPGGAPEAQAIYANYLWNRWFSLLGALWVVYAFIMAGNGVVPQTSCTLTGGGAGVLYMLSLPVTRARLLYTRAAVGAAGLALLALTGALSACAFSPLAGQSYPLLTAVAHAVILAGAGMGVYGAFVLLAAILNEPLFGIVAYVLIAITVFTGISRTFHSSAVFSLFDLLRGTSYHVDGVFPWTGVLAGLAAGALFIRVAATAIEHRDF